MPRNVVVDQNALTNERLIRELLFRARAGNVSIVVADMALIEASKMGDPEAGMRLSLRYVADYPNVVVSAFALVDLLRSEWVTEFPRTSAIDDELTPSLRRLLSELVAGHG